MRLPISPRVTFPSCVPHHSEKELEEKVVERSLKLEKVSRLCRRKRRGAAVVEFAVVAPLFFLLVFGMIEFGRMVMVQQVITNASREGARVAVLEGTTSQEVVDRVDNYLTSAGISSADVQITDVEGTVISPGDAGYGEGVKVTVSIGFDQVSWLPSPMFLGGNTLSTSTVMRRETVQ